MKSPLENLQGKAKRCVQHDRRYICWLELLLDRVRLAKQLYQGTHMCRAVNHQIYTDNEDDDDDDKVDVDDGGVAGIYRPEGGRSPLTDNGSFRGWTGQ